MAARLRMRPARQVLRVDLGQRREAGAVNAVLRLPITLALLVLYDRPVGRTVNT